MKKTRLKRARQKYPIVKNQDKLYIKKDKMHRNSALSIKALRHGVEKKKNTKGWINVGNYWCNPNFTVATKKSKTIHKTFQCKYTMKYIITKKTSNLK